MATQPLGAPPRRPRASWHLRANAIVVAWLGLTVAVALAGELLPAPRWLLIHVFLLGAVSTAILIWSEHFTVALLRVRTPSGRGSLLRLAVLNVATVAVLAGVARGPWQVAAAGAALMVGVVLWHAAVLVRLVRQALPGRFGHVIGWYVSAAAALAAGGVLGGLLAAQAGHGVVHERLHAAHAEVNLLGWVGLTVLGTLFTLWPTVLRTRMPDGTRRASRVGLRLAAPGLAVAVAGLLAGWRWVALAGLVTYAAGGWRRSCRRPARCGADGRTPGRRGCWRRRSAGSRWRWPPIWSSWPRVRRTRSPQRWIRCYRWCWPGSSARCCWGRCCTCCPRCWAAVLPGSSRTRRCWSAAGCTGWWRSTWGCRCWRCPCRSRWRCWAGRWCWARPWRSSPWP
ncbi:hypothetical protein ACFQQB_65035 [Nonomuraea rubra]|uniref:hypothetical protein n=1 Tax=Nonomuraea rubra TaxID=46180 RepID=UPI00360E8720